VKKEIERKFKVFAEISKSESDFSVVQVIALNSRHMNLEIVPDPVEICP
jgi:hypothetical protein